MNVEIPGKAPQSLPRAFPRARIHGPACLAADRALSSLSSPVVNDMRMLNEALHLRTCGFATDADVAREEQISAMLEDLHDGMPEAEARFVQARLAEAAAMRRPVFVRNVEIYRAGKVRGAA